jgi:hypothetical protein
VRGQQMFVRRGCDDGRNLCTGMPTVIVRLRGRGL